MEIGPVQYAILAFPGNQFNGDVVPALTNLIESNTIRLLDLLFIGKNADGEVLAIEFDELDELSGFGDLDGEVGGILGADDIAYAAETIEPNSSAALLVWEDLWAAEFQRAVLDSGGVLVESGRVPAAIAQVVFAELPPAV